MFPESVAYIQFYTLGSSLLIFFNFCNVYLLLRDRERQSVSGGGAERERKTQNLKEAPGSELSAQSPTQGSNPQAVRS